MSSTPLAAARSLADLKSVFDRETARVEEKHAAAQKETLETYGKNLAVVVDRYRKHGDLDKTVAAVSELERFEKEKTVLNVTPDNWPTPLIRAHTAYGAAVTAADTVKKRNNQALIRRYLKALEKLKTDLVRQGNLDQALAAKEEIEKAEFILADIESQLPGSQTGNDAGRSRSSGKTPLPDLLEGLVLHYSFDNNGSTKKVVDKSGKENHGQVTGATITTRKPGDRACEFSEKGAHISVSRSEILKMVDAVTLSTWIKPNNMGSYQNIISDHGPIGNNGKILRIQDDHVEFLLGPEGTEEVGCTLPSNNKWYHVVASYDGNTMALFLNGKEVDSQPRPGGLVKNDNILLVGKSGYGELFKGALDEIMIWDRGLTASEIERLHDLQK